MDGLIKPPAGHICVWEPVLGQAVYRCSTCGEVETELERALRSFPSHAVMGPRPVTIAELDALGQPRMLQPGPERNRKAYRKALAEARRAARRARRRKRLKGEPPSG